jgi:putative ABC transport system permease protein
MRDERTAAPSLDALRQDLRYAFRLLRGHPGFSLVAIVTLALGIGANTAVFSVVAAVLLRPLPYPEPQRLVEFRREVRGRLQGGAHYGTSYRFLRDHLRAYEHVTSFMTRGGMTLSRAETSESLRVLAVSPSYFATFGVAPARGRAFTEEEAARNGPDAVILSHRVWQRSFHGDPAMLERVVLLGGTPHQVVGIMPEQFESRPEFDLWIPLRPGPHEGGFNLGVVARLRDGVTWPQAQAELDSAMPAWMAAIGAKPRSDVRLRLKPVQSETAEALSTPLIVLMSTVALVLVTACANLANLLLAWWTLPALVAMSPVDTTAWGAIAIDGRVLAFSGVLSLATGVLFGLMPALHATRIDLTESCKEGGRASSGRRTGLLRQTLIVGEVAVSVTLLIGALLLVRTFWNLLAVDPGFDPRHLTVAQMPMSSARYGTTEAVQRFYATGLDAIRQIPGVESAAVILNAPMEQGMNVPFVLRGPGASGEIEITDWRYITPDYFRVMRVPLRLGRTFTASDTSSAPRVAIVNQQFVRRFLRDGRSPIGQRLQLSPGPKTASTAASAATDANVVEIVGVVGDTKQRSLREAVPETVYVPVDQTSSGALQMAHTWFETQWIVRTRGDRDEAGMAEAMRRTLRTIDPRQPFGRIRTMASMIDGSLTGTRFGLLLIGASALLAVVLAAAGLFGVIAYAVAQRRHEMGVRLALGATAGQLIRAIVYQGSMLAALGVVLGVAGALALTRLLASFIYGVTATDPLTFASAAMLLLIVSIAASLAPALRLMRLDPVAVLRRG